MLKTLNKLYIANMREGRPVEQLVDGQISSLFAQEFIITPKIIAHCRDCQCILDVGTRTLRAQALPLSNPTKAKNGGWIYIHESNCREPGFIQTFGFRGKAPGKLRFVDNNGVFKIGDYDFNGVYVNTLNINPFGSEQLYSFTRLSITNIVDDYNVIGEKEGFKYIHTELMALLRLKGMKNLNDVCEKTESQLMQIVKGSDFNSIKRALRRCGMALKEEE